MKNFPYLLCLLVALGFTACVDDEDMVPSLDGVAEPTDLDLAFDIAADNTGAVTIQPLGTGVTLFRVDFGDGERDSVGIAPGETITHVYELGVYTVELEAMGINGAMTTYTEELTVNFAAPTNLVATIERTPGNPFAITVSASADLATAFDVTFGEDDSADAVRINPGETASHTYSTVGEYEVCVTAVNGGSETIKVTETVTVSDPTVLPITFENQNTEFFAFGGAGVGIIDNPDASGENTSGRVAEFVKTDGSEVWAGTVVELGGPLDLSSLTTMRIKAWSPAAGIPVLFKLENATDPNVFLEVTTNTTVANEWEIIDFSFAGLDLSPEYSKVAIFFNFGTAGTGESYYFDDLMQTDGSATINLPLGFEQNVDYVFTGFGGGSAGVITNPDASGSNVSSKVVEFVKETGSQVWAGVFTDVDAPINFSGSKTVKLKVWSPKVDAPILLKLENPDNSDQAIEVSVPTTVANQWEELTYDFTGAEAVPNLRRVVLFADFGTAGDAQSYYFDDLRID
ncbi:PKD domain-containing protein [Lewinella sp. 4G2]|uniref:PKD domain-containing protein n=1 Tax=Lewinella sp. 4G2 TaxID=1803372 RepID=UPI0007B49373|nr:PKD domain-containing protein [Lewinella sp. 4G2]OAV44498.1 hypothetical protein A3850_008340 [Lewinella sp. 4G2]